MSPVGALGNDFVDAAQSAPCWYQSKAVGGRPSFRAADNESTYAFQRGA